MTIKDLEGKLVAVLGFGQEGRAVTQYLMKHGVKPVLFDQKEWKDWPKEDQNYIKSLEVNFIFGPGYLEELKGLDVAFRSPGIKLSDVERSVPMYGRRSSPMNRHATKLILTSQTKWFFEHCPAKIIGVAGTKGKGTTSALIYEMLKCSEPNLLGKQPMNRHATSSNIYLTGNIGYAQPLDILDDLKKEDWVVYELSSFQLQDLTQSPHIGVVLMVTSEHLDYHESDDEYLEAKSAITKFQTADDFALINADFENSAKIGEQGQGKKIYFSRKKILEAGCFVEDNQIVLKLKGASDFRFPTSDLQLRGRHNWENVCAAVLAAHCAGCSADVIKSALKNFKGLEHRLEFVAEKAGIKFYNDSFSTTPETAIAAIEAFDKTEIVILGGSSKNSSFDALAQTVVSAKNIKALILIGQEAPRIKKAVGGFAGQVLEGAKSMSKIFDQIKSVATSGDVVLLSPACASFGMFKNYKDRGEQFKKAAMSFREQWISNSRGIA